LDCPLSHTISFHFQEQEKGTFLLATLRNLVFEPGFWNHARLQTTGWQQGCYPALLLSGTVDLLSDWDLPVEEDEIHSSDSKHCSAICSTTGGPSCSSKEPFASSHVAPPAISLKMATSSTQSINQIVTQPVVHAVQATPAR